MSLDNGQAVIAPDRAKPLANYPHARVVGGFVFVSGVSSRKPDNTYEGVKELPDGSFQSDIKEQTKAVIQNIKSILELAGTTLNHLVDLTVFLKDAKDANFYHDYNEVYNQFFEAKTGPTRSTVIVKELPSPKILIEIKAVAVMPPHK